MERGLTPWLPRWRARHAALSAALLGVVSAAVATGMTLPRRSTGAQVAALVAAVAVFGVPHGALDGLVGRRLLAPRLGRAWWGTFLGGYSLLAGAVLIAWWLAPAATLTTFLAASAVHFGLGDVARGRAPRGLAWAEVCARGAAPVAVPALAFPDEVARAFGWVAAGATPEQVARLVVAVTWGARWLVLPALAGFALWHAATAWRAWRAGPGTTAAAHAADAVECVAVPALAAALPPFVAFLVYFCLLHSARHAMGLAAELDAGRAARAWGRFARAALPATGATLAAGGAAWAVLRAGHAPPDAAAVRVLFVGLTALTAPHMLLTAAAGGEDGVGRVDESNANALLLHSDGHYPLL